MNKIVAGVCVAGAVAIGGCTTDASVSEGSSTRLTNNQLESLLTGKTVTFDTGSRAIYRADGSYEFRGFNGQSSNGQYSFRNNSVCVNFSTGHRRCDAYFKEGNRYYLANDAGTRFQATIR